METEFPYQVNNYLSHQLFYSKDHQSESDGLESLLLDYDSQQSISLITKSAVSYLLNPKDNLQEHIVIDVSIKLPPSPIIQSNCVETPPNNENLSNTNHLSDKQTQTPITDITTTSFVTESITETINSVSNNGVSIDINNGQLFDSQTDVSPIDEDMNSRNFLERQSKYDLISISEIKHLDNLPDSNCPLTNHIIPHYMTGNPRLLRPPDRTNYRLTVIFDLDETLICIESISNSSYRIYLRPYVRELLQELANLNCEIMVWSAGVEYHVKGCLDLIDPEREFIKIAIYRDNSWFDGVPILKSINLIPYRDLGKIILIENNPHAAYRQLRKTLILPSYLVPDSNDQVLNQLIFWFRQIVLLFNTDKPPITIPLHTLDSVELKYCQIMLKNSDYQEKIGSNQWETNIFYYQLIDN